RDDSASLKPRPTKQAVSPPVRVIERPVWPSPSKRVARKPVAILIDDASLLTPPRLTRAAVSKLPVGKLACQPPKLQCWKSWTVLPTDSMRSEDRASLK